MTSVSADKIAILFDLKLFDAKKMLLKHNTRNSY